MSATVNAPAWVQSVTPAAIADQRRRGWPDFHPEDFCHTCGRRNPVWFAPATEWTSAMGETHAGITCPPCFADAHAAATGDGTAIWEFRLWAPSGEATP